MMRKRWPSIFLLTALCCVLLLPGCSEEQKEKDAPKTTLQEQLGEEAAKSLKMPLEEARKAAELQTTANQKILDGMQSQKGAHGLEGC